MNDRAHLQTTRFKADGIGAHETRGPLRDVTDARQILQHRTYGTRAFTKIYRVDKSESHVLSIKTI